MVNSSSISITPSQHAARHVVGGADPLIDPLLLHDGGEVVCRATAAAPNTWTDLDLSAIVGANLSYVDLIVRNNNAGSEIIIGVRPKGSTFEFSIASGKHGTHVVHIAAGADKYGRFSCMTDANGVVQIKSTGTLWMEMFVSSYIN